MTGIRSVYKITTIVMRLEYHKLVDKKMNPFMLNSFLVLSSGSVILKKII